LVVAVVIGLAAPTVVRAQESDVPLSPPPLVPAVTDPQPDAPPPVPPNEPVARPPHAQPPGQPQTGYPYSPAPAPFEKPGPEIGLLVSESLFGMLTAAGVTLLPYFLLLRPIEISNINGGGLGIDPAVGTVLFILVFAVVPLAVSQTIVSLANGSRLFQAETWPAALVGLGVAAASIALYFLMQHDVNPAIGVSAKEWLLLINTIAIGPLAQVLITNLTKKPRPGTNAAVSYSPRSGLSAGVPIPAPLFGQVAGQARAGVMVPLFSGVL